jgi:hypothetical protein
MSKGQRNIGIYARIAEAFCDGKISFLLRCCQRGGIVGPIHVARSGKITARVKVGTNDDGVDVYKPQLFESEADVRAIMNQAAKDDEVKKDESRAVDSKKFTVQRLKSMAEYKMVYCDQAMENISLRARTAESSGTGRLSGTQKLHQEFRLARELRTVRPARPRPPVTMAGAQPLRNQGRKRSRDTEAEETEGAKRQQLAGRGRGRGRGSGRGGGRGRGHNTRGGGVGNADVNGFGSRGGGGNRGNGSNERGNNISRGNGRGGRSHTQPTGSPFLHQQQPLLPPSLQQSLLNSFPPAFLEQYAAWNGGSEENPVTIDNTLF